MQISTYEGKSYRKYSKYQVCEVELGYSATVVLYYSYI